MRRVVDTNVAVTANGDATNQCVTACGRALLAVANGGHLFVDAAGDIVAEYRKNLAAHGDPRAGNAFFKWLLTNEWNPQKVTRVAITKKADDKDSFNELPDPPEGVRYDPSDRKFLAVSAAHPEHPPVLQALDSKWWGWKDALQQSGVIIHFLCPDDIARKHEEKTRG